jgi:hypothetical protein
MPKVHWSRGAPIRIEGKPDSFAVAAHKDCVLIGVISLQSQIKGDSLGGNTLFQRGSHSLPCSFFDVIELFGSDASEMRLIDAKVASFEGTNQFVIPRIGDRGLIVEAEVDLPNVAVKGLKGAHNMAC